MVKTTNILDLNNRLEKVEKENVAQNSYTSLKNKPKINSHILTGDKSSSDLGLAAAGDITDINNAIGNMSDLVTTARDLVGAINEEMNNIQNLVTTDLVYATEDIVIAGNSMAHFTISATKNGYIPIGIVGWAAASGIGPVSFIEMRIVDNNVNGYIRNFNVNQTTISNLNIRILYIKDFS